MKNIVFDGYAIICHFRKEKVHEEVSEELSETAIFLLLGNSNWIPYGKDKEILEHFKINKIILFLL